MSDFNQNNDDEDIVVTLDLDDGSQVECEILTIFTVGERDYIAPVSYTHLFFPADNTGCIGIRNDFSVYLIIVS